MRRFKVTFYGFDHQAPGLQIKCSEFSIELDARTKAGAESMAIEHARASGMPTVIPKSIEEVYRQPNEN